MYFVEVHSVVITLNGLDNIAGREIFGVIEALSSIVTLEIYKETKESCKPLLADGTLYLTGPSSPIKAPAFAFYVYLKDKHTDFEVSNGYYYMQQHPPSSWYNKPMSIVFEGKHGIATLYATMYSYAVAISVQVRLINTEGLQKKRAKISDVGDNSKSLPAIHGTVYARLSGEKVFYRRTLFSRSANDPQRLVSDVIPLSRCVIVLPRFSSFVIETDLWEETDVQVVKNSFFFEDTITEQFRPETPQIKELEGVEVKLTWHE